VKWLAASLFVVVLLLQYRLWLSASGVQELTRLEGAVSLQRGEDERLADRNRQLAAEVRDLKSSFGALEERARSDLGMIANNETFYQVVPANAQADGKLPTRTAAR
jgi:cell division protein FtsB